MNRSLRLALLCLAPFASVHGQGRGAANQQTPTATAPTPSAREEYFGPNEEKVSSTPHIAHIDGKEIKYTATVGTIPIRLDNNQIQARMFFVAYTKDGEDAKTRPISFLYNGGPGAA